MLPCCGLSGSMRPSYSESCWSSRSSCWRRTWRALPRVATSQTYGAPGVYCPRWLVPRLERFGLIDYFERTIASDAIGTMKPDPAAYRCIVAHVSNPALAVSVDDRTRNVAAAASLGLKTVQATIEPPWIRMVNHALGLT